MLVTFEWTIFPLVEKQNLKIQMNANGRNSTSLLLELSRSRLFLLIHSISHLYSVLILFYMMLLKVTNTINKKIKSLINKTLSTYNLQVIFTLEIK